MTPLEIALILSQRFTAPSTSVGGVPKIVFSGNTFIVPYDMQVLFTESITVETNATIELNGTLVEVK